ncbi:MAG TPA: hypothetical protein VFK89_00035 [Actinomycetota bacterium]|nr:hypothetical protein [Actinomycetota bacterium]
MTNENENNDEGSKSTDGPGSVEIDEPTEPALSGKEEDEFDKQAENQETTDS